MDWDEAELAVAPARARLEAEDPDGALSLLRELPADTEALLHAALIGAQIDSAYAVEFAAAAAAAGPADPGTLVRAADIMIDNDDLPGAARLLRQAGPHVDEEFPLLEDFVNLSGKVLAAAGEHELAEESLRAALESDPETRWYAADLADFLVERGRHSEALATVTEGLRHHPDEPRLLRLRDELRARRAHGGRR